MVVAAAQLDRPEELRVGGRGVHGVEDSLLVGERVSQVVDIKMNIDNIFRIILHVSKVVFPEL